MIQNNIKIMRGVQNLKNLGKKVAAAIVGLMHKTMQSYDCSEFCQEPVSYHLATRKLQYLPHLRKHPGCPFLKEKVVYFGHQMVHEFTVIFSHLTSDL